MSLRVMMVDTSLLGLGGTYLWHKKKDMIVIWDLDNYVMQNLKNEKGEEYGKKHLLLPFQLEKLLIMFILVILQFPPLNFFLG